MKKSMALWLACLMLLCALPALAESTPEVTAAPTAAAAADYAVDALSFTPAEKALKGTDVVYAVPDQWVEGEVTADEAKEGVVARWAAADERYELTVVLETGADGLTELAALRDKLSQWTGYSEAELMTVNEAPFVRYLRRPAGCICLLTVLDAEAGQLLHLDLRTTAIDEEAYQLLNEIASTLQ